MNLGWITFKVISFQNSKVKISIRSNGSVKWKAPSKGWLKINVYGAFDTQTQQGGLGFVIRDSAVSCLGGGDRPILHGNSADHTELLEAHAGCCVRSQMKSQLNSNRGINTSLIGRLYEDFCEDLKSSLGYSYSKTSQHNSSFSCKTSFTLILVLHFFGVMTLQMLFLIYCSLSAFLSSWIQQ